MSRNANKLLCRFTEAVADCTVLIKNCNDEEEVSALLVNRAYCYGRMDQYKLAIQDYVAVLGYCGTDIHCLFNRGICYEKLADYKNVSILLRHQVGDRRLHEGNNVRPEERQRVLQPRLLLREVRICI